jgi:TetR/AcrR family transcriptional repressor of mexCD-oprJ operon
MSTPLPHLRSSEALQQRVASAIVEAAARVLAERGERASMSDVAAAAGVARATVYRHFPSRQALLGEVARLAVSDAGARLVSARIDEVPAEEGIRRAVRALVDVGSYLSVLTREHLRPDDDFEQTIAVPLRGLFERGQSSGEFRADVSTSWLTEALVGLTAGVVGATPFQGKEDTIAAITGLFLDGARARTQSESGSEATRREKGEGEGHGDR